MIKHCIDDLISGIRREKVVFSFGMWSIVCGTALLLSLGQPLEYLLFWLVASIVMLQRVDSRPRWWQRLAKKLRDWDSK